MNKVNRAAQFLPFDALKGLQEELRKREEIHSRVEKTELTEEQEAKLSAALIKTSKNTRVKITFFYNGHYVMVTSVVAEKNLLYKYLTINGEKIYFDDIYELIPLDSED